MSVDFGRYEVLEEIARGSYGIVYKARDRELDRVVALKALRHEDAGPLARERFVREARLAASLNHPNVVKILDTGEHGGRHYYTMPLLDGAPPRGPMLPSEACRLVERVARAVAHAHRRGVVHRDLKPANILVCDGEPILTDFGVARGPDELRVTETGELLGTPAYMAPEQARGDARGAGPRADVYALGVLLFELLTGAPPYGGASATHVLAAHLLSPVPRLPAQGPHGPIPGTLGDLVARMMAKSAGDRPGTMAEVEAALAAVLAGEALPAPRSRLAARPWTRGALAVLAVAAIAGAIVLVARRARAPAPTVAAPVRPTPAAATSTGARTTAPAFAPAAGPTGSTTAPARGAAAAPPEATVAAPAPAARPDRAVPVPIELRSTPSGARVTLHGRSLGQTPLSVRLPPDSTVLLVFEAQGRLSIAERVRPRSGLVVTAHLPPAAVAPGLDDLKASPY